MVSINLTLLLQAGNFFIAYLFLRNYIFAPGIKILRERDRKKALLLKAIEDAELQKNQALHKKEKRWIAIKKSLHKLIPSYDQTNSMHVMYKQKLSCDIEQSDLSEKNRKKITDSLYNTLSDIKS